MTKMIAIAAMIVSLGCGAGSNELALLPLAPRAADVVTSGTCTNTPDDCGVKVCVDCTADAPPGTEAGCVASKCVFRCAATFHKCGTECLPDSVDSCGPSCTSCTAPSNGSRVCLSSVCDFTCNAGFVKSNGDCVPLSFSISY